MDNNGPKDLLVSKGEQRALNEDVKTKTTEEEKKMRKKQKQRKRKRRELVL